VYYKPDYLCDLHCHTCRSDGNDTYQQLIDFAAEIGMKAIAITDHDIVPEETMAYHDKSVSTVEYGKSKNIVVLLGVEYSCDTDVEDVHIVGLGCDWTDKGFAIEDENMRQSKIEAYRKLTEVLSKKGIRVSWDELLENGGNYRNPQDIQRKHIFEMIAAKGYASTWQEAKLMIKDNPEYNVKREKIHPLRALELIHSAGGLAILAHPYLIDEPIHRFGNWINREDYIQVLIESGLDGIEAAYTYSKTSYKGSVKETEIEKKIIDTYKGKLKIISGGSDYHNDGKKGVKNPRMLGEKGVSWEYFMGNKYLNALIN